MYQKVLVYSIREVVPYINWLYFYHAWGLSGKPFSAKQRMQQEALAMLASWYDRYHTRAVFALFPAHGDVDDLVLYQGKDGSEVEVRIPMLRQQQVAKGKPNLCLADFLRPKSFVERDEVGIFCASVDASITEQYRGDAYNSMMSQVLCDRLAEATVERMHEQVRRIYWGYAPDEQLEIADLHKECFQGIRPAVGYPSLPDLSVNFELDQLLDFSQIGVRLTQSGMMQPHASVSGFMFSHPQARYFELGKIGEDQLRNYAHRRGIPVEMMRKFLQSSLLKS